MKFERVPGEFAFHAAVRVIVGDSQQKVWHVTPGYFLSIEDVRADFPEDKFEVKFPVEINENGTFYIPDPSELQ